MANLIRRDNRDVATQRPRTSGLFLDPFRVMDELMRWDPFRGDTGVGGALAEFIPNFEVKESKDAYIIRADLPGVRDADLEIAVTGNVIQISGRREQESRQDGDRFFAMERAYGQFSRAFSLPEGADPERVSAELREGVLTVTIPKKPEVQPKRIAVSGGQQQGSNGGQGQTQGTGGGGGTADQGTKADKDKGSKS
jgi:HSP20 family protein